mgnify:CR=1 FL=1
MTTKEVIRKIIAELTKELGELYPDEYWYCSYMSLYSRALHDGRIKRSTYDTAKKYYGSMWDYVGD